MNEEKNVGDAVVDRETEQGFTRGPWEVDKYGEYVFAAGGQMTICTVRGWGYLTGRGALNLPDNEAIATQEANARLIAAAPALYERLKDLTERFKELDITLCDNFEHPDDCDCEGEKARAALALVIK